MSWTDWIPVEGFGDDDNDPDNYHYAGDIPPSDYPEDEDEDC